MKFIEHSVILVECNKYRIYHIRKTFRFGYSRAVSFLKSYPEKISTSKQLKKANIPYIGKRLKKKMLEIIETGETQKAKFMEVRKNIYIYIYVSKSIER